MGFVRQHVVSVVLALMLLTVLFIHYAEGIQTLIIRPSVRQDVTIRNETRNSLTVTILNVGIGKVIGPPITLSPGDARRARVFEGESAAQFDRTAFMVVYTVGDRVCTEVFRGKDLVTSNYAIVISGDSGTVIVPRGIDH